MTRMSRVDRLLALFLGFALSVAGYLTNLQIKEFNEFKSEVRKELSATRIEVTETRVRLDEFMGRRRYRPTLYDQAHYIYPIP